MNGIKPENSGVGSDRSTNCTTTTAHNLYPIISVTGFGKISPLWQFFEGLFRTWKNIEPNLAEFYDIGQIFIFVNGPR